MTLRLLCDEHVGKAQFYPKISNHATTRHVLDEPALGQGANDSDIWKYAVTINFNVFTADTHFRPNGKADPRDGTHPGVIFYDDDANTDRIIKGLQAIESATTSSKIAEVGKKTGQIFYLPGSWA